MPDIKLIPDRYGEGDCAFVPGDVVNDPGLQTAVYISLFTDAADPETGEGGYWGDALDDTSLGSLLWTIRREKMTAGLPERVRGYCLSALQWMIDQQVARSVAVTVTKAGRYSLMIGVDVVRPDFTTDNIKFSYNWAAQVSEG